MGWGNDKEFGSMLEPEEPRTETLTRVARKERQAIQFRRSERLPSRRPNYAIAPSSHGIPERSRTTGLVFQAILGAAACLALVGVVSSTQSGSSTPTINPGSPDAPPPALFVQFD